MVKRKNKRLSFQSSSEYVSFLRDLKYRIKKARSSAFLAVNAELIKLYFSIGKNIVLKQKEFNWGDDFIGQIEKDIKKDLPEVKGFSRRNINYMRAFYKFAEKDKKMQQLVAQIPWGHIIVIISKTKNKQEALFYINKTIKNSWSRVILEHQISLDLYKRQGKMLSNFKSVLSKKEDILVQESFKESYILDFLQLSEKAKEKELEEILMRNITDFIMEMGKGFAFVGRQYKITIEKKEFFIDLLFYNYVLQRFVVIELKTTEFKPEHIGQLGFYITAVDKNVKTTRDKQTIGLIICKTKNKTIVEYALNNLKQPAGVAEYKILSDLPKDIKDTLPSEKEVKQVLDKKI